MKKLLNNPFLSKISLFSLICSLALCSSAAYGQTDCSSGTCIGNVTLNSIEDITEDIRSATRIEGNLRISDSEAGTNITNAELARLQVDTITGNLTINLTFFHSLDAFNSLRHIGDSLNIGGFDEGSDIGGNSIRSMSGFDALETIGGSLLIEANPSLATITAFGRLRSIGGQLFIQDSPSLTALPEFLALRSVGSGLSGGDPPININGNRVLSLCCGLFPFLQRSLPTGYSLGGDRRPIVADNATGCNEYPSNPQITNAGACPHELSVSAATEDVGCGCAEWHYYTYTFAFGGRFFCA